MSTFSVPAYLDYESAVSDVLTAEDESALQSLEESWGAQAAASATGSDLATTMSEWANWLSNSPAYRAIAYAQNFDAGQQPAVLQFYVTNWRSAPELQPILDKVLTAENTGAPAGSGSSGTIVGLGGTGLLILVGLAVFLLGSGSKK